MKKQLWVRADQNLPWDQRKDLVTCALESGADAVVVKKGEASKASQLGKIKTVSEEYTADIVLVHDPEKIKQVKGKKAFYREIEDKSDEEAITEAGNFADYVVVKAKNWTVIPLENIIASLKNKSSIIVEVESPEDARLALETLEVGCDGVVVSGGPDVIISVKKLLEDYSKEKVEFIEATVTSVTQSAMGDRVCVDTCSLFNVGEGMLIGSQSSSLFLVHSETIETPYVAKRPFRVNAGPVHAYTLLPNGKTKYLSELLAGDKVLAVDYQGNTRTLVVGRVKIEKRPLILVEAEHKKTRFRTLLQNAETIRLVGKNGEPISVAKLKEGDKVLVRKESTGRHFGMQINESIEEK